MAETRLPTEMAREITEIPAAAERLVEQFPILPPIVGRIREARPSCVVVCGRGSSGHVGTYLKYVFEVQVGLLVSTAAPSVFTAYRRRPDMRNALFIVVSQSGRSPDLVRATEAARELGALTLAIVNDAQSPAADASELVLPIAAGQERAVAATKTVVLSMKAGAGIVSDLTGDLGLTAALHRLPARLANALACDWSAWGTSLVRARAAFVIGRGYGLGPAREIALKLTETLGLPGLGYSAAEVRHGPRAAIAADTPVLVLRQHDETAPDVDDLVGELRAMDAKVFCAGGPQATLPWIGDDYPVCDPVAMLVPAYAAIEAAARQKGLDPDRPPYLSKVTRTL